MLRDNLCAVIQIRIDGLDVVVNVSERACHCILLFTTLRPNMLQVNLTFALILKEAANM